MPNIIAYIALLLWPLIVVAMFRKMAPERALIWSILGGYMLLPPLAQFSVPLVPPLDKTTIPNLSAALVCIVMLKMRISVLPEGLVGKVLMLALLLGPVVTVLTNTDPIRFGVQHLGTITFYDPSRLIQDRAPGLRIYDSLSNVGTQFFFMIPFFLGRHVLAKDTALKEILIALVVAGLIYSVPMLFEVATSPQLNTMVYGFFQHDFTQAIRGGGYRPFVFMPHGLWVAFFTVMCLTAALTLFRESLSEVRGKLFLASCYLAVMLVLCKSLGPMVIGAALAPMVLLLSARMQMRIAALFAAIAIFYPLIRGSGLLPTEDLTALIESFNPDRAASLAYRFDNEDLLLARAAERPWFGWGYWGRNQIHDPLTGEITSVTDGAWIIFIGENGWVGYLARFGLLALPVFSAWLMVERLPKAEASRWLGPLSLILGANMVDMLPNATLIPFTWLLAGAILGHVELTRRATAHAKVVSRIHAQSGVYSAPQQASPPPPQRRTIL
ncbi:hypothetical protein [Roseicitreum antarcticum]|nr:hypothetical protein [Roseicitreum antarcticum]